ncbi:phosphate ABC transporter ATP-binding protein [Phocicoccus pinnipedialis]|uniref:Glycine betaine/carnitine/choline transport ATP-binding protein OpuCA n=1 Tax=Phocicoccus pinnipedialis TaxID=110845 RepID=A0A6V7R7M2_9BACL|nr:phosphate ABC transporter ATP-binding protein [Jeotgalicoccus pinnipedialis]MBP1938864.1 putative ABC transport system ATP-binding protein [Jeotgalicoccus pinnipedialis]CAD2073296.1 Glycine betaine/carnitine/choline transport ATP-binding protein OpuCA [Jeotgalicoccus pinnipedialis]
MSLIEFKNVSHNDILNHISGDFKQNKITALVGPSGAGKSTTLKHINGLVSADSGDIYFKGKNINDFDVVTLRRGIGMAFQSSPMIEGTVYDNLKLPRALFNESLSKEEAVTLLSDVDLNQSFLDHPVKKLSGGERSRVALARTLVNKPDVLLLDEITASLDYRLSREIERLIVKLQDRHNLTIVWVTHNLEQAKRVSDDIWFLSDGELIESGEVDILENPKTEALRAFLRSDDY